MSCGDINYITNSKGIKCITVVLSVKQVVTIGIYVREVRAPKYSCEQLKGARNISISRFSGKKWERICCNG